MSELRELVREIAKEQDTDLWKILTELGLTTIGVPDEAGGSGGGLPELSEVVAALAEHGLRTPIAEYATAAWVAARAGFPLPDVATVASESRADPATTRFTAPWGSRCTRIVVLPTDDGMPTMLDTAVDGVQVESGQDVAAQPLDRFAAPTAALVGLPGMECEAIRARLSVLRSAAMVGAVRGAYALTRDHVRTRAQFGRPLVRIPAVGTALARFRVELLQAETALDAALSSAQTVDAYAAAAAARVVCGAVSTEAARLAHQLHGAIGITQEYTLHRLTRLLWALRDADMPEERWAHALGEIVLRRGEAYLWDRLTAA